MDCHLKMKLVASIFYDELCACVCMCQPKVNRQWETIGNVTWTLAVHLNERAYSHLHMQSSNWTWTNKTKRKGNALSPIHWVAFAQMNFQKDVLIELVNGRRANRKFISKCVWFRMAQKGMMITSSMCSLKAIATTCLQHTHGHCLLYWCVLRILTLAADWNRTYGRLIQFVLTQNPFGFE